ncbi:hypothetical protein [Bradyrhizobium sp. SZCCHNRI1073]|uniref:hypothetical protein n=1 Tax=Bradyrhizobium sp. SZCCHNRI1073 TaxID=3057280 RepID=UPI002915CBE0|nr:hypothetical protein [Bradyrhizobium sp. SZCCHNRI1073]
MSKRTAKTFDRLVDAIEEIHDLRKRIDALESDLMECQEYFEDRMDVRDGADGEQLPNREMQLYSMIEETLNPIRRSV